MPIPKLSLGRFFSRTIFSSSVGIDKESTRNSLVFRIGWLLQSSYYFLNLLFMHYFIGYFVADSLT